MECRITSTKTESGATLMEYVVAVGVGALLVGAVCAFSLFTGRSLATFSAFSDADLANRTAVDQMTKDFRGVTSLTSYSTNVLNFVNGDGTPLIYVYDPDAGSLTRSNQAKMRVLLRDCVRLQFGMNMRNMSNGTFLFFPTANVIECKAISVDWTCRRKIMGKQTEDWPQTATIVIRN